MITQPPLTRSMQNLRKKSGFCPQHLHMCGYTFIVKDIRYSRQYIVSLFFIYKSLQIRICRWPENGFFKNFCHSIKSSLTQRVDEIKTEFNGSFETWPRVRPRQKSFWSWHSPTVYSAQNLFLNCIKIIEKNKNSACTLLKNLKSILFVKNKIYY